jgi:hypothetical protein
MTTIFTCRSVVRYNLSLDGAQKEEVLQDIDASLEVLRACLLTTITVQTHAAEVKSSRVDKARVVRNVEDTGDLKTHSTLQELYRMYYAYLDMNKQTSLQSFVVRFNEVISVLDDVQRLFEQGSQSYETHPLSVHPETIVLSTVVENLLQKVKIFISDLYYVFMDFIRTLSSILQQNNVQLDTEKLTPSLERRSEKIRSVQLRRMHETDLSLQSIQEAHQQLRRRWLQMEPVVNEAAAFLEFLKETLQTIDVKMYKIGEIIAQTDAVSRLLSELILIIADYETIATKLLSMH